MKTLAQIQKALKAPKSNKNTFGNYNYRSCEDILEALKPLLDEDDVLKMSDLIVYVGDRYYIETTVQFNDHIAKGYAREPLEKKGCDASQITGGTSSYARKYALNAMFAIDDTKDADSMDNSVNIPQTNKFFKSSAERNKHEKTIGEALAESETLDELAEVWKEHQVVLGEFKKDGELGIIRFENLEKIKNDRKGFLTAKKEGEDKRDMNRA